MWNKNRLWFLRFVEGTDGAQAGGVGAEQSGESGETPDDVDWEARAKELEAKLSEVESERDKWKRFSRKNEDLAKESQDAAEKLKALEEDGKTDVEKLQAQLDELVAEREAERQELAKVKRAELITRISAAEGVREEDREFLPDTDDEEILRKHAKRLATPGGAEAPNQGLGQPAGSSREAIIARAKAL